MLRRSLIAFRFPVLTTVVHQALRPTDATGPWARLDAACVEMNGYRDAMEDAHILSMYSPNAPVRPFGVFDGHSGHQCAELVAKEMEQRLIALGKAPSDDAITQACVDVDALACKHPSESGCVATFASVWPDEKSTLNVKVANIGDARIVRGCVGNADVMESLTEDHVPDLPLEKKRIEAAGGFVQHHRVCGGLAPSRAFGDVSYKGKKELPPLQQMVCVQPDFKQTVLNDNDFLVIACDGVYERKISRADVVDLVNKVLSTEGDVVDAATTVIQAALQSGSTDNISCMVVWNNTQNKPTKTHPKFIAGPLLSLDEDFIIPYMISFRRAGVSVRDGIESRIGDVEAKRHWPTHEAEQAILEQHLSGDKKEEFLSGLESAFEQYCKTVGL
eukprot:PhM_4_TR12208/c0_g1_i1/m.40400/K14803/PTC2_3; protein phosphatase PTC2/3